MKWFCCILIFLICCTSAFFPRTCTAQEPLELPEPAELAAEDASTEEAVADEEKTAEGEKAEAGKAEEEPEREPAEPIIEEPTEPVAQEPADAAPEEPALEPEKEPELSLVKEEAPESVEETPAEPATKAVPTEVMPVEPVIKEPKTQVAPIQPITRELTLEEEAPPLMQGISETRQEWFAQASEYTKKIDALTQEINRKVQVLHESQRTIDKQLDALYNKIYPEVGSFQKKASLFKQILDEKRATSTEARKIKLTLNTHQKNIQQAQLAIEELQALEKNLLEQLILIESRQADATSTATQADKVKQNILSEEIDEKARKYFIKIIELYGNIVQADAYVTELEQAVTRQGDEIAKHVEKIEDKSRELKQTEQQLQEKITTVEIPQEIDESAALKAALTNEQEAPNKKEKPEQLLSWYEKGIAAVAIAVLTIRDFFRDLFGSTQTEKQTKSLIPQPLSVTTTSTFEEQIDTHLKKLEEQQLAAQQAKVRWQEIEKEKAALLGQLNEEKITITIPTKGKPLAQESTPQLIKRIWLAMIALGKKITNPIKNFVVSVLIKAGIMLEFEPVPALKPQPEAPPEELGGPEEKAVTEAIEPQMEPEGVAVPVEEKAEEGEAEEQ